MVEQTEEEVRMFSSKKEYQRFLQQMREEKDMEISKLYNKTADQVLELSKQTDAVPVDLKKILKLFNISAIPKDFSKLDLELNQQFSNVHILGIFVSNDKNAAIFYNKTDVEDSHRYRFTIAHELAHCCLQGEKSHIEFRVAGLEPDENELAANTFAGALLIPEKSLNKALDELIVPSLHALADIFEVSENVMKARLQYLKIKKSIVGFNY